MVFRVPPKRKIHAKIAISNATARQTPQSQSARCAQSQSIPIALPLSRKKSLPDVQELPRATHLMCREEVSALGSARREEIRRQIELSDRLKANPLLYLVSPQMKVRSILYQSARTPISDRNVRN